jgi:hypothetical protein
MVGGISGIDYLQRMVLEVLHPIVLAAMVARILWLASTIAMLIRRQRYGLSWSTAGFWKRPEIGALLLAH